MTNKNTINDTKLLRLIDREKKTQVEAAKELGVTKQAVNYRLKQLRGKTTHAVIANRIDNVIEQKIDTWKQLEKVNQIANDLLDQAEDNVQDSAIMMREIREQLKLQMELFKTMWDVKAAMEFQDTVLTVIGKIDPEIRKKILHELNAKSAIRNAVTFR
ncbi:MAG: winged helix-turn-helix transcriptional regulator [Desulfobulbaceae bacterium]|nr:winged helix-turn-helix transcriptional regulator [Desulfobulbaceae bacterium]